MSGKSEYDEFAEKVNRDWTDLVLSMSRLDLCCKKLSESFERLAVQTELLADAMIDEEEANET